MTNLLVTGGSGYLGSGILARAPRDWQIAATWSSRMIRAERVQALQLDLRAKEQVRALFAQVQPEVVIHTAALMSGNDMHAVNVEGARHVARAAARAGARLIHLSTDVIFDGEHAPYKESDSPQPISPYGKSKAEAEEAVKSECPGAVIVRTSLIYGFDPVDPRTRQSLDGAMPYLFTDEFRCPLVLDDLADALLELCRHEFAGVLHVAGPQPLSRYEFGVKLAQAFAVAPRFAPALAATSGLSRPRNCTLDVSLAQNLLRTPLRGVDQVLSARSGGAA